jgi:PadR family transcriptional regulator, regulatory protein AphA
MSLEHAILGFLNYKPFSGYDLKKMFDNSVRHFWPADQSQIYRTLGRLAEKGWTDVELVEQADRPDRKVYHLTEDGKSELHCWLTGPISMEEHRSPPLVQIFFAGQLSDEEILVKFRLGADMLRAQLGQYEHVPAYIEEYSRMVQSPRETFCWMLTLESGLAMARSQLEWMESVVQRIENGQIPQM